MLDREERKGEITMLDERLKEIVAISQEILELYQAEDENYNKDDPETKKLIESLGKLGDSENLDPNIRWLVRAVAVIEARRSRNYITQVIALNVLTRLSIRMEQSIRSIASELSQLEQPIFKPLTEVETEKISKIETELTKLNEEFKKYRPTLKKFKQALDRTEKTLRDYR